MFLDCKNLVKDLGIMNLVNMLIFVVVLLIVFVVLFIGIMLVD